VLPLLVVIFRCVVVVDCMMFSSLSCGLFCIPCRGYYTAVCPALLVVGVCMRFGMECSQSLLTVTVCDIQSPFGFGWVN
jgi:hypothetical protein